MMEHSTSATAQLSPIHLVAVPWDWRLILQLILAIVGILGNSLVIHVYLRTRRLQESTTNTFIAALAVADLITSICIIPHPLLSRVPDNTSGHFYCKVVFSSNVMWISIVASIFTLTALALERYVAISFPTRYRKVFTKNSKRIILISIWLSAFIINTFSYYVTHLHQGQCIIEFPNNKVHTFIGVSLFLVEYLIPMLVMLVANIRTFQLLHSRARALSVQKDNKSGETLSQLRSRRRVTLMLLVVIITFIICWSPDQFAFLAYSLGLVPTEYLFGPLYRAFVLLAFANSCVNPIIYTVTNKNFRNAIKQQMPSSVRSRKDQENTLFETPIDGSISSTNETSEAISPGGTVLKSMNSGSNLDAQNSK